MNVDCKRLGKKIGFIFGLEKQYFIDYEPKGEVISSKIDRLADI